MLVDAAQAAGLAPRLWALDTAAEPLARWTLGAGPGQRQPLLNRLVGLKVAFVSDKPQTTRNRILAVKNYGTGEARRGQIVFVDTPGIHRPLHRMNVRMDDAAVETLHDVDVLVLLVDASERAGRGDRFVLGLLRDVKIPVVLALNKIDLVRKSRLLPMIDAYQTAHAFAAIVPISALTGDGVDRLERVLLDELPEGEALYADDYLTDLPERVLASEIVREKVLRHTRDELPFSTAVVVDQFEDQGARGERGLLRIYCTILVEQESQKPIVIGNRGARIKRIGQAARTDIEELLGCRVFIELFVRDQYQHGGVGGQEEQNAHHLGTVLMQLTMPH